MAVKMSRDVNVWFDLKQKQGAASFFLSRESFMFTFDSAFLIYWLMTVVFILQQTASHECVNSFSLPVVVIKFNNCLCLHTICYRFFPLLNNICLVFGIFFFCNEMLICNHNVPFFGNICCQHFGTNAYENTLTWFAQKHYFCF